MNNMKRALTRWLIRFLLRRAPIARIDFPRLNRSYLVLDEETGWAPSHVGGTPMPEQAGNCILQFAEFNEIQLGDEIVLQPRNGQPLRYRVRGQVAHDRVMRTSTRMLTLVTARYAIVATPA